MRTLSSPPPCRVGPAEQRQSNIKVDPEGTNFFVHLKNIRPKLERKTKLNFFSYIKDYVFFPRNKKRCQIFTYFSRGGLFFTFKGNNKICKFDTLSRSRSVWELIGYTQQQQGWWEENVSNECVLMRLNVFFNILTFKCIIAESDASVLPTQ